MGTVSVKPSTPSGRTPDTSVSDGYQPRPDDDVLVDVLVAARMLSISHKTLYNWKQMGRGPRCTKVGRSDRWSKGEIRRWLHERTDER